MNFGDEHIIVVKNDVSANYVRHGLLQFDTTTAKVSDSRAFLNIYIDDVNDRLDSRTVTIMRLAATDWEKDTVTMKDLLLVHYSPIDIVNHLILVYNLK